MLGADSMTRGNRSLLIVSLAGLGAAVAVALRHQAEHRGTPEPSGAREATVDEPAGVVWPVNLIAGTDDAACAISPDELKAWRASGDLLVADLRPSREFEGIRIPGSVNFPVRELKTKLYLRERRLLLVDRGYRGPELEAACRNMRDSGFHTVRVLAGGLEAWRRHIGPLAGEGLAEAALYRVGPEILEGGLRHGEWVVIDVTDAGSATELFRPVTHVPFNGGGGHFVSRLRQAITTDGDARTRFVVLVDRDGKRYEAIKQAIGRGWPEFLYFLDGGLEAYRAERANHEAMLAAAMHPACRECGR
jgi:rhodanese-related sulfurtransferase